MDPNPINLQTNGNYKYVNTKPRMVNEYIASEYNYAKRSAYNPLSIVAPEISYGYTLSKRNERKHRINNVDKPSHYDNSVKMYNYASKYNMRSMPIYTNNNINNNDNENGNSDGENFKVTAKTNRAHLNGDL